MLKFLSLFLSATLIFTSVTPSLAEVSRSHQSNQPISLSADMAQKVQRRIIMQEMMQWQQIFSSNPNIPNTPQAWIVAAAQAVGSASGEQVIQYAAGKLREAVAEGISWEELKKAQVEEGEQGYP
ncbi:MAG: hypothetical protein J6X06_02050, partial [Elusimicrobiaceae bacterium]|nr:hypothetical protein [Elusimicrobiaceae bacterium]